MLKTAVRQRMARLVRGLFAGQLSALEDELAGLRKRLEELFELETTQFDHAEAARRYQAEVSEGVRRELEVLGQHLQSYTSGDEAVQREVMHRLESLLNVMNLTYAVAGSTLDDIPGLRRDLRIARTSPEYEQAFLAREPLVSVRIGTYNRADLLIERSVTSARSQTYENIEIIVVGDGCTDDTEARLRSLGDPRIRFYNQPFRWSYPDVDEYRWLVIGSPTMNVGAQLARGLWIAPLDDDDEFRPDHIEALLNAARSGNFEMACGKVRLHSPDGSREEIVGSYPPRIAEFGFQAAIYLSALRFFEYNTKSWMLGEPGDWNLCRRMIEAGVRIGWLDKIVTEYYPSRLFFPSEAEPVEPPRSDDESE